jgi:hypothetical protein
VRAVRLRGGAPGPLLLCDSVLHRVRCAHTIGQYARGLAEAPSVLPAATRLRVKQAASVTSSENDGGGGFRMLTNRRTADQGCPPPHAGLCWMRPMGGQHAPSTSPPRWAPCWTWSLTGGPPLNMYCLSSYVRNGSGARVKRWRCPREAVEAEVSDSTNVNCAG